MHMAAPADLDKWFAAGRELGRGSFSVVRRATLPDGSGRAVAVKQLPAVTREVLALAMLPPHPNIANYIAHYQSASFVYLATQCCDNAATVQQLMADRRHQRLRRTRSDMFTLATLPGGESTRCMTVGAAMHIVVRVARALAHAHAHGVSHRDVSAHNVLVTVPNPAMPFDGCAVRLVDWGFAHVVDVDSPVAVDRPGTVEFAAPELVCLPKGHCYFPPKTDCWALGVMAYYMLTGCTPFGAASGSTMAELAAVLQRVAEADPGALLGEHFPAPINALLAAALVRDTDQRATAKDVAELATAAREAGPLCV